MANITNLMEKYDIVDEEEEKGPNFLLFPEESVVKIACGPLHTLALTNRNRLFAAGYGEKYALGTGKTNTLNEFTEIKVKNSHKVEKIETGVSCSGFLAGGKAFICGTFGEKVI